MFRPWRSAYKGQAGYRPYQAAHNLRSGARAGAPRLSCRSAALDPGLPQSKLYSQATSIPCACSFAIRNLLTDVVLIARFGASVNPWLTALEKGLMIKSAVA